MMELKTYFSLQISLLMGAGRLGSSAPPNAADNKGFGSRLDVSKVPKWTTLPQINRKYQTLVSLHRKTYAAGMDVTTSF